MNSVAPASCARFANEYYETDEELLYACADAMREEYKAIIDAGLILQLDDPAIAESWDQSTDEPSVEAYQRYTMVRIDALNHAIRGLPAERIRFHLCWGSWHGPHSTDIPMADIVEVMLAVNAGRLLLRGRQRPPRARVAALAGRQAARGQGAPARRRQPRDQRDRAPRGRRRPDRAASPRPSAARTSSPRPTAASAAACTRRSPGRSSRRSRRARRSPPSASGAEREP